MHTFCILLCFAVFEPSVTSFPHRGVEGRLTSLAPPVHLSGERLGWTMLVCMVTDFRRGHLEVSWRSLSEGHFTSSSYSLAVNSKHHGHSAVATITVATRDWPSYSCSVTQKRRPRVMRRHHTDPSGHQDKTCHKEDDTDDVVWWTNTVVVMIMRLLLMKSIAFNTLITIYAVIK
ncbi:uncharacterized protein LOC117818784 isoform X2 [Notolabrus celidotus]|uniref:uncharacterized protein LOC117818784 isoform X2 n=1 Tax=Notolabrus celidotus TaxID=1203425 RepID=UPI00148FA629|nr:uncharacterized protein LOC117818784 isoform X2 [Notolabrus celidotus]